MGQAATARRYPLDDRFAQVLDDEQREAAEVVTGPVCIIAGAGTGKTRTITHRIAHAVACDVVAPEHILAVTFTARAAGELRERLTQLGVGAATARTFHSAALRQLQYFWGAAIGGAPPTIVEQKAPIVAEAAARIGSGTDRATIRDLAAEIEWAKVSLLTPATYVDAAQRVGRGDVAGLDAQRIARLLDAYEVAKTARGVIDFEDVLLLTTAMIERREDVAGQIRARYRWFTVDEYQDVSAAQQRLLMAWLGDRRDVCVVGDPNQTIYTFAGADSALLTDFRATYGEAVVVRLRRNYRSTPDVVALGNAVLGAAAGAALISAREGTDDDASSGLGPRTVTFTEYDDEVVEADAVAAAIAAGVRAGWQPSDVAVLVRANAQLESLEEALASRGVAYVVRGGERFFARREVKEAITLLRGAAKAASHTADDSPSGPPLVDEVKAVLSGHGWAAEAPAARGAVRQRWESLAALVSHAERFAADHDTGLGGFLADLDARASAQHAPRADGITLATMHSAKGLEWRVVFLPGVADGTLPISMATTIDQLAEERRLLYVAVTRARDAVRVSWARSRTPGGRATRRASRFLDGVRPATDPVRSGPRPAGDAPGGRRAPSRPATCKGCRGPLATAAQRTAGRCEHCPPRYDQAIFDALRSWRATEASTARVPAYVVFSDATLEAIAEATPSSVSALAAISGVGAVKLDRYGSAVLGIVAAHTP